MPKLTIFDVENEKKSKDLRLNCDHAPLNYLSDSYHSYYSKNDIKYVEKIKCLESFSKEVVS